MSAGPWQDSRACHAYPFRLRQDGALSDPITRSLFWRGLPICFAASGSKTITLAIQSEEAGSADLGAPEGRLVGGEVAIRGAEVALQLDGIARGERHHGL